MNVKNYLLIAACAITLPAVAPAQNQRAKPNPSEPTVVRVYNVQDLIAPRRDFPLASSTYAKAFVLPSGQLVSTLQATPGPGGEGLFGQQPKTESAAASETAATDSLIKLLEDDISPETWKDMGGAIGSIHTISGSLVITQTQENHKRIADLLGQLARDQGGMVRVSAEWIVLSPADARKFTRPNGDDALAPVDPAALDNLPPTARRFSGQTLSRNGQTVYLISGLDRSVVTSATPVVSTGVAAYATDVSNIGGGIALEINSRVNWEQKSALVTLSSTFSDPAQVAHENVAIGGTPATQPTPNQTTIMSPAAGWQPFSRLVQDMRTTVRLPLGAPVIAGTMTLHPDTKSDNEQVLVLVLKVTASK